MIEIQWGKTGQWESLGPVVTVHVSDLGLALKIARTLADHMDSGKQPDELTCEARIHYTDSPSAVPGGYVWSRKRRLVREREQRELYEQAILQDVNLVEVFELARIGLHGFRPEEAPVLLDLSEEYLETLRAKLNKIMGGLM